MEEAEKRTLCEAVGKRIRSLREEQKMTKEKLAEAVGITTQYVSDIEMGKKCMSMSIFVDMGKVLHISLDKLATGVVKEDPRVDQVVENLMALSPLEREMTANMILAAARVVAELGREL